MTDPSRAGLPRHVAIIMDGNGRWATQRGLSRVQGHRRGKESVREIVETAREVGIEFLTLYAFSTENWERPGREVGAPFHGVRPFSSRSAIQRASAGERRAFHGGIAVPARPSRITALR